MVKDIRPGVPSSNLGSFHSRWQHPLFPSRRRNQRIRIVEERRNSQWHRDGQGHLQRKWQQYPSYLTAVGNTLYFEAGDGTNGNELWKSDGTASGTMMVKDIRSGGTGSYPSRLTAVGNTLYFGANDGINGYELWKSDGTASGTVMVKDINSGSMQQFSPLSHSRWQHPLFPSRRRNQRNELWKSDGTASGTVMVKDIRSGSEQQLSPTSQPLATPSISKPTTEPTEENCGRAMEQPQAQ